MLNQISYFSIIMYSEQWEYLGVYIIYYYWTIRAPVSPACTRFINTLLPVDESDGEGKQLQVRPIVVFQHFSS